MEKLLSYTEKSYVNAMNQCLVDKYQELDTYLEWNLKKISSISPKNGKNITNYYL